MNYHFSLRAFSDQDQHIETIYSSKLSYGTHTWLSFIVELLTNLPSNSDGIYESQPPCRSFKLTLSFAETLTHYFLLKNLPSYALCCPDIGAELQIKNPVKIWSQELSILVQKSRHISSFVRLGQSQRSHEFFRIGLYHEVTGMLRMVMDFRRSATLL